ncbi:cmgc cdk crk7 kinase [Fusarium heterosporum]|uniref:cyclin-dependent kinase n=1 Tax=Fusarium heterosporum TaxID=42747 RepID=A0A8H5WN27_FUSHE|nr:cmgc cdk crk7 kinase [Fusarium heterosporum]
MAYPSKPPRRPRNAAMRDDQERDDQGERARAERGVKPLPRSRSPRQVRDSHRASHAHRERPSTRPDPRSSRRRRHSHDRSRDRAARPSPETSRRVPEVDDLIPRYRAEKERHRETEDKSRQRSNSRSRDQTSRASPSAPKRHRSRSPSLIGSNRKRSRRDIRAGTRDYSPGSARKHIRRPSRDRRKSSPRRYGRSSKSPSTTEKLDPEQIAPDKVPEALRRQLNTNRRYPGEPTRHLLRTNVERRSREGSPGWRHSSRSDIDEDMTSRGNPRGGYNPLYPQKSHIGNDPYSQSPQHASYHNSPSRSPYGSSRGGWNDQQSYPPQYPQGSNHGPPSGPSSHYHSNPSRSPPYDAPTGPMQPYPQGGSYRGGYRGGGFRGGPFAGRGRGGFKNSHWNQGPPPRGHHDDSGTGRFSNVDEPSNADLDPMDVEEEPFHSHDRLGTESGRDVNGSADPLTTPNRPPPTGPGSSGSKFSFAFKASSKPAVTAPKPEISQKLNAAPRREPQKDNRDREHNRDRGRERDRDRDRENTRDRDREPPRSAPTEPASARLRHDRRQPPEGPKVAPRMRKVKKIMKRPKTRPTLSADLVDSESVFFRKPGNESVVGSGTYGKVFKGINVYTKGMVALKRIRMEGERDGFPVTAVREIKLLQSLRHINIVNLQEVMVEKNDCFMVFEYLSHDLTGLLNHPTFKLEAAQKKDLAKQMFEGLDYLHTRGVLHRDIKAANILVSNEGVLKIADFGLARFYAKRHQLDYTNRVITIWYRSPELLLGETKYTAAVDVWSAAS